VNNPQPLTADNSSTNPIPVNAISASIISVASASSLVSGSIVSIRSSTFASQSSGFSGISSPVLRYGGIHHVVRFVYRDFVYILEDWLYSVFRCVFDLIESENCATSGTRGRGEPVSSWLWSGGTKRCLRSIVTFKVRQTTYVAILWSLNYFHPVFHFVNSDCLVQW